MPHIGNNIARLRGFRRLGQKQLADKMNFSQQEIARLEQKETINDEALLEQLSTALNFPIEIIKNLDETTQIQTVIQEGGNQGVGFNINPIDKIIELYERLLELERNKNK